MFCKLDVHGKSIVTDRKFGIIILLLCCVGESRFEVRSETDSNNVGEHCRDEQTGPYLRTTCDEPFARRGRLNSRKQPHSPVNVYICSECQKRSSTKQILMQHMNIHTDNYKCTECGRCCKSGSELCL